MGLSSKPPVVAAQEVTDEGAAAQEEADATRTGAVEGEEVKGAVEVQGPARKSTFQSSWRRSCATPATLTFARMAKA
eukprot:3333826-Amphidinium_carterae.1